MSWFIGIGIVFFNVLWLASELATYTIIFRNVTNSYYQKSFIILSIN